MSGPIEIKQTSNKRRLGGAMLALIGLPLTGLWLWLGFPPRLVFADLIFLLGGPGMLAVGLWAAFWQTAPRTRLAIWADRLVIYPTRGATEPTIINWTDLTSVTQTGMSPKQHPFAFRGHHG